MTSLQNLLSILFQAIMTGVVGLVIAWVLKRPMDKYLDKRDARDIAVSRFMSTYYSSILKKVDTLGEIVIVQASINNSGNPEVMKLVEQYKDLDRTFREATANNMADFSNF